VQRSHNAAAARDKEIVGNYSLAWAYKALKRRGWIYQRILTDKTRQRPLSAEDPQMA